MIAAETPPSRPFPCWPAGASTRRAPSSILELISAASSEKTLMIMFIIALIGMPLVLAYTTLIYWTFRGKVQLEGEGY